jgi:hypothetical protein
MIRYSRRRRRELSIGDYNYLLGSAERVDLDATPHRSAERARRNVVACLLAALCGALLASAIWFGCVALRTPSALSDQRANVETTTEASSLGESAARASAPL